MDAKGDYLTLVETKTLGSRYSQSVMSLYRVTKSRLKMRCIGPCTCYVSCKEDSRRAYREKPHGHTRYIEDTTGLFFFLLENIASNTLTLLGPFTLFVLYICYSFSVLRTRVYMLVSKKSFCLFIIPFFQMFRSIRVLKGLLYHGYNNADNVEMQTGNSTPLH